MNRFLALFALLFVCAVFSAADTASACPTCKAALAEADQDDGDRDVAGGYMWSIIFMMSAPFLVVGGLGVYFYRKIAQARDATQPESSSAHGAAEAVAAKKTATHPSVAIPRPATALRD